MNTYPKYFSDMRKPDRVRQPRPACTGTLSVVMSLAVFLIGLAAPSVFAGINWYEDGLAALHEGDYDLAIKDFTLMLEVFPEDYEALSNRGVAWFHKKAYDRAIEDAARALEINPYYSIGANQLAWMLATCPDPQYRDGRKAVMLAEKVVERFPDQAFVLDHIAKPFIKEGAREPWATDLQRLARYPNVACKVSGMVTEADWQFWRPADMWPYLDIVFEAFGPERIMFGSDWPVCTVAGTYEQVAGIVSDYVDSLSEDEQVAIWGGTAAEFYGLER